MRADPRCPACAGKVSATAEWCMHCGQAFERPVDHRTGEEFDDAEPFGARQERREPADRDHSSDRGTTTTTREAGQAVESTAVADDADWVDAVTGRSPSADVASNVRTGPLCESVSAVPRALVGRLLDWVTRGDDRLDLTSMGIVLAILGFASENVPEAAIPEAALGTMTVSPALVLSVYFYTRQSPQETVTAWAYGSGVVVAGFHLLGDLYRVLETSDSVAAAFGDTPGWLVFGGLLVAVGVWIERLEFPGE